MTDHPAERTTSHRDDESGHDQREEGAELDQKTLVPRQEPGRLLGERAQVVCGDPFVVRADDPVDETDREVEPLRVLQQVREALLGWLLTRVFVGGGVDPSAYEIDTFIGKSEIGHIEP